MMTKRTRQTLLAAAGAAIAAAGAVYTVRRVQRARTAMQRAATTPVVTLDELADNPALFPHTRGETRRQITVRNPDNDAIIGHVPVHTREDVARAAAAAREAQRAWAEVPIARRVEILAPMRQMLLSNPAAIHHILRVEGGKSGRDVFAEPLDIASTIAYYSKRAPKMLRPERRISGMPLFADTTVLYKPVGLVGAITAWNFPLILPATDAVPALLAGNAILIKPSEFTPYAALWFAEQLKRFGLPDGLVQVVTGDGAETGAAVTDYVDHIAFTGSTAVGKLVARQAGERLIPMTLELGGKNPAIVLDDAEPARAADILLGTCFGFNGQVCIGIERVYVPRAMMDDVVAAMQGYMAQFRLGVPDNYSTQMGPMINPTHLGRIRAHIEDAVAKGATVVAGGQVRPELGPSYIEPTVLVDVPPHAAAYREETFGPVVALYPYDALEDAIAAANDTVYGLNAVVISGRPRSRRTRDVAARLEAGTVNINEFLLGWATYDAPMGGVKQSGAGFRHGPEGLVRFTQPTTVVSLNRPGPHQIVGQPLVFTEGLARLMTFFNHVTNSLPWWS